VRELLAASPLLRPLLTVRPCLSLFDSLTLSATRRCASCWPPPRCCGRCSRCAPVSHSPTLSLSLPLRPLLTVRRCLSLSDSLTRADGKQLCCPAGLGRQYNWPAVNPALGGENWGI
jgi:hypothetical protein